MTKSYEDILKEIKNLKYTSVKERNTASYKNSNSSDDGESVLTKAIKNYNNLNDAVSSIGNYSNNTIKSNLKVANNFKNKYKSNIINTANQNNIMLDEESQGLGVNLPKYRMESSRKDLKTNYADRNKKNVLTKNYFEHDKEFNEARNKYDEIIKPSNDYKEYSEYAYKAVPLLKMVDKQQEINSKGTSTLDKIIAPIKGGLSNSLDTFFNQAGEKYQLANGKVKLPTKADLKAQKTIEDYKTPVGKFLGQATYSIGQQVPSMIAGAMTGGLASGFGATTSAINTVRTIGSLSTMFANVSSSSSNQKMLEGYTEQEAKQYGMMSGAIETGSELLFGGLGKLMGVGALDDVVTEKLTKNIQNRVMKNLAQAGISSVGEGIEEFVSDALDPLARKIALGEDINFSKYSKEVFSKDTLEDMLVGTISSAIMSAPSTVVSFGENKKQNNPIFPKVNNEAKLPNLNSLNNVQNNIFSKQVDEVINGTYPKTDMLIVNESTPQILQDLGLKNLPITMTQKHLDTIMNKEGKYSGANYHNLGIDVVKQLPDALNRPLNVLKSATKDNSIVVVTDLSDKNNNIVIASIAIDGKGQINHIKIDSNVMTSAYGKNNYDTWMQKNKDNIIYDIDEGIKKGGSTRIQYPRSTTPKSDVTDRLQLPIRDSSSKTTSDIPKNISPISYKNDSMNLTKSQNPTLSFTNNMSQNKNNTLNPLEISSLNKENAITTPILPNVNRNKVNDGESKYWSNILEKTDMLNVEQKNKILQEDEVKYYDKVTNKESLDAAFERLNKNGYNETINWFNKESNKADATDVAEGWILLKQYADSNNYDGMVEVAKKMRDIGSKAGQTVQAFNIMERMTPEGMVKYAQSELTEAYNQMFKNKSKEWIDKYKSDFDLKPEEVQFIMDNMKEISKMEDGYDKRVKLAEIQKIMTDKLPPQKGAAIKSWMRISMLFNPKTQVRNVVGKAIIAPVNYFGDLFSSYADKLIAKKTGVRTTGNMNVKAILKGFKEGAYEATNDYRKGINTKDMEGNRFEIGEGKSFSDKNIIGRNLNRVEGLLNYVMDAGDRMFSQSSFENSLQNQMILNNTTEITQDMIDIAHIESLQRTWNDNNSYTKFVLDIRRMLNRIGTEKYGLGDVLIPFAKTPANLTKAIVEYSPVGLATTLLQGNNLRKSLNNGQYTAQMQHKFVQNLGKATAGTILYIAGYALAKANITSGDSDDDKDVANFLKNTLGISSYSIKIGDKTFSYDWAQPIAAPLSITANIVKKQKENASLYDAITTSLDEGFNVILEQSFFESINNVFSDPGKVSEKIGSEILSLPARAVPTFSKQIVDLVDGTQRTSFEYNKPLKSAVNSMKAKILGLSKTLAPSVDSLGREIKKYGGKNNLFNVFLNPANVNTENISESAKEIYRLYKEIGDSAIMPRVANYYVNKKNQKIIFTSEQKANYQKKSGEIVEKNVKKLLETSEYEKMNDKEKVEVIKDIVNYSYNISQKEILGTEISKTYQKAYDYSKIGNISDYYTFKNSIDNNNKKKSISSYLINSNLSEEQISNLYGNYYSSEEKLNNLLTMDIPIKEYIKLNSEDINSNYSNKTGKTISGSKKKKVMEYVNSLNLNIAQKAILIKMQYKTFKNYDKQIGDYINKLDISLNEKKILLKSVGFDNYNRDIIDYINSQSLSIKDKEKKLKNLGFTIRNGRVYS